MKIYTKTGDRGSTSLIGTKRVKKSSPLVDLNGTIDEAQACLGLARASIADSSDVRLTEAKKNILSIEKQLWMVMSDVASLLDKRRAKHESQITENTITELEFQIDYFMDRTRMPKDFVVPGDNLVSAHLDLARTVVRRAERISVNVNEEIGAGEMITKYLNRLSDYIYALARYCDAHNIASKEI